jgi:hypothetical protein
MKRTKTFLLCLMNLVLLTFISYKTDAQTTVVNTSDSTYAYLHNDTCSYDDQTNAVVCMHYGAFQNIKKVDKGQNVDDGQLVGSIIDSDGKQYDLYAMSPQQALNHTQDLLATIQNTAAVLFNPIDPTTKGTPKPNPYALTSINAAAVDELFGEQGLGVDASLIQYFKNFYFYLEYVVRLEYGARLAALAHQENIDMASIIEDKSWQGFVTTMETKFGGWANLEQKLFSSSLVPNYGALQGLIEASSWQELVTTPFWISLNALTTTSLMNSGFWQKYLKYSVSRSFIQDQSLLLSIKEVEETIFKYIPNIEVAYYNPDFTSLRNASEMFHISLILTDAWRMRALSDCNDWQSLKDSNNNYDLTKVYNATVDFKKTAFYSIAALAEDDPTKIYANAAQNKVPVSLSLFKQEPLLQEELLLLSMIKVLHALTIYLYDSDHLENTMNVLANKNIKKPLPSIFIYAPEDFLYLEDLNLLHNNFKESAAKPRVPLVQKQEAAKQLLTNVLQNKSKPVDSSVKVQGFFSSLWHDVKHTAGQAWSDIKKAGSDVVSFAQDAGKAIANEAKSLGFGTAAVFLSGIAPGEAQKLLNEAKDLQSKVADEVNEATNELGKTVTDIEDAAEVTVSGLAKAMQNICGAVSDNYDPEICKSIAGAFESAFDVVITEITGDLESYIYFAGGMIQLSAAGIALIANASTDVVSGNWSGLGDDLKNGLITMGADAAVAILEPLTLQFKYFMQTLADALKFCQYFISILTRVFIDATTAITYAIGSTIQGFGSVFGVNISPSDWANTVDTALSEHERLIGTCITTALLLATIPLTGGASIPLIVMTVGPQIFAAYGSYQADELAIQQKHDEKEFVHDFQIFVENNKTIYKQQQDEWSFELNSKYESELENQERGLGFYENFLADNFESLKEQMSSTLGSYWSQLFTPDAFTMVPADIGSLYGFKTGVYELNPSQGFALYSAARKSFSQEIAVFPALALNEDGSLTTVAETKNWFNQKEIVILNNDVSEVEIRFKGIYLLNSFYIGLYYGGELVDVEVIKKTQQAPIDFGHLAKMAVFKKEDAQHPVTFGVYEHEGKGWLTDSLESPQFKLGEWYHIKMQLNGTNLSVKVWTEPNEEPSQASTFTVSASPSQKMIGVISSGASVEYQFINPTVAITANPALRPETKRCALPCDFKNPTWQTLITEKYRENIARSQLNYLMAPTVGNIAVNAVGKMQILRGQYIYTTKATNLVIGGSVVDDYVVTCKMVEVGSTPSVVPGTIGQSIISLNTEVQGTLHLVSLINENAYSADGKAINMKLSKVFDNYVAQYGPLSDTVEQTILSLCKQYYSQGMAFTFGTFSLKAASQAALEQNLFLYTTILKDDKGNVVKDTKGNQINDYFLLTALNENDLTNYSTRRGNPGISYNEMITDKSVQYGILSLVSGNLYNDESKLINSGFRTSILLRNYENNHGKLAADLKNDIVQAQTIYQAHVAAEGTTNTPNTGPASQTTNSKDMGTKTNHQGSAGNNVPPQPPANNSVQQRTNDASGGQTIFGGP